MSGTIELESGALAYSVTGKPRADGKVLYQIFGADRKVWRLPPRPMTTQQATTKQGEV